MANVNGSILGQQAITVASGDSSSRPSGTEGLLRFNNTLNLMEYHNGTTWISLDSPPTVSSISPTTYSGEQGTVISITGTNFAGGCTVKFTGLDGTIYNSPLVTFISSTSVTATTPQDFTVANEPYDVTVTNPSGLSATLDNALDAGVIPVWSTTSGNIFDGADDAAVSATIAATDADSGSSITYSVASGLPSGVTVSSSGTFSGTPSVDVTSATTYTFNATATDNAGNTAGTRSFNIILRPTLSSAGSYPTSGSNYSLYTTGWTASSSDMYNLSHASSTFRVPANVYAIRVMIWGGGAVWGNSSSAGHGGYTSAILRVTPLEYYKVIVAGGATMGSAGGNGGYGGNGMGGGCSQDGNDNGVGGGGSGFFYAANTAGTTVTSEATMFSKGVLIAGGGGCPGNSDAGGIGNGGAAGAVSLTIASQVGYGIAGGGGAGNTRGNGAKYNGYGGDLIDNSNAVVQTGSANGGAVGAEGYGGGYVAGCGGGRGAGGGGGGNTSSVAGENATGDGGRGSANYNNGYNPQTGPGAGGYGPWYSTGGNGFRFNSINLGGGGGGGHGASNAGGGFSGGGSAYYDRGGGGGSGCAFGYMSGTTPTLSGYTAPSSVSVNGGNAQGTLGVPSTAGSGRGGVSNTTGYNGAVLITW